MTLEKIAFDNFLPRALNLWGSHWMLLTVGNHEEGDFNTMAVGWGSFGTMWEKPFASIVVRPTRHTYTFLERYDTFTLCALPERLRERVLQMGTTSGRDGDKIAASGLTPVPASIVPSPVFAEAELAVECRKIYWDDLEPGHFLVPEIEEQYPEKDYHRMFFGEIVAVSGVSDYSASS